ncbi:MAG: hypothetical protein ACJAVI_004704 [Candidatus Azotimanducaceae bacterium]|jgi:hypothetical protein
MSWFVNSSTLICFLMVITCGLSNVVSSAEVETIYLEETYISGNQELPKVLYILPWKNQSTGAISAVEPRSSLDRVMTLVYPHEYRLELNFRSNFANRDPMLKTQVSESENRPNNQSANNNPRMKTNQVPTIGSWNEFGLKQSILKED